MNFIVLLALPVESDFIVVKSLLCSSSLSCGVIVKKMTWSVWLKLSKAHGLQNYYFTGKI